MSLPKRVEGAKEVLHVDEGGRRGGPGQVGRSPGSVSRDEQASACDHPGERAVAGAGGALGLPFYTKDGQDICYIKPDKDFLAFGFGEVQNPAYEEGVGMHQVAWTLTSLDDQTEATIRALLAKVMP